MNAFTLISAAAMLLGASFMTNAWAADGIPDNEMGLDKNSVFDTPTPVAPVIGGEKPQVNSPGAPPQIPHSTAGMVPVRMNANLCIGCHHKPMLQGKEIPPGVPTPIPASHYVDTRTPGASPEQSVRGQRYICTQCHTPQADVSPLVGNTFSNP